MAGIPADRATPIVQSLNDPLPISLPSGSTVEDPIEQQVLDDVVLHFLACTNRGVMHVPSHATDNFLATTYPFMSLEAYDEFIGRTGGREVDKPDLGFGGSFGWMTLDDGRKAVFFLTGLYRRSDGGVLEYPEVYLAILLPAEQGYLLDQIVGLGSAADPGCALTDC